MQKDAWKSFLWVLPELVILAVILRYSLPLAIFFSVCVLLFISYVQMHYLRKIIRAFHVVNENRMFAVMESLNITDEKVKEVIRRRVIPMMTPDEIKSLDRDFRPRALAFGDNDPDDDPCAVLHRVVIALAPPCATMKIYLPVENPQVFEARG